MARRSRAESDQERQEEQVREAEQQDAEQEDPAREQESMQPEVEEAEPAESTQQQAGGEEGPARPETGFRDVSEAQETAREEASKPLELDDEGNVVPRNSEPAAIVMEEMSYRSSAQANGGGPWPPEVLAANFTRPRRAEREIPVYTSHEQD